MKAFPFAYLAYFAVLLLRLTTAPAVEPRKEILLWPNGAPGSEGKNGDQKVRIVNGERVLSNIHKPSLTPYLPPADKATGCAVIIAPGGGHRELWFDHEDHNVARWLREQGIAAFVLKYRLARETNSTYTVDDHALADMQRALRLVRSRATEWSIATNRISVMAFSAGGEVAFLSTQRFDSGTPSSRPSPPLGEKVSAGRMRGQRTRTTQSIAKAPARTSKRSSIRGARRGSSPSPIRRPRFLCAATTTGPTSRKAWPAFI